MTAVTRQTRFGGCGPRSSAPTYAHLKIVVEKKASAEWERRIAAREIATRGDLSSSLAPHETPDALILAASSLSMNSITTAPYFPGVPSR